MTNLEKKMQSKDEKNGKNLNQVNKHIPKYHVNIFPK